MAAAHSRIDASASALTRPGTGWVSISGSSNTCALIRVTTHIASAISAIFTQNRTLLLTVVASLANSITPETALTANPSHKIGRASCRERVELAEVDVAVDI